MSLLVSTLLLGVSCSSNTPGKRAVKFNKLINRGELSEAVDMVYIVAADSVEAANKRAAHLRTIEEKIASRYAERGGVRKMKIVKERIISDSEAYVEVELNYRNGTQEKARDTYLLDKNGLWCATLERF